MLQQNANREDNEFAGEQFDEKVLWRSVQIASFSTGGLTLAGCGVGSGLRRLKDSGCFNPKMGSLPAHGLCSSGQQQF
jgi:hypothetical protein